MDKINFLFENHTVDATVQRVSDHIIRIAFANIIPKKSILLSGFNIINEHNGNNMSDDYYHKYNTLYLKIDEKTVMLSNNGSVYVSPEDTGTDDNIIIEPHIPTLAEAKQSKITELSSICNMSIITGIDLVINDKTEHFSYTNEDQVNIKELFDLVLQTNTPMYYHADGESCKLYTAEQIISLYTTAATNKMHHTTYLNQLKMYIETLEDTDTVNGITYGQELTGIYLNTYNNAMAQANLSLEALLEK